MKQLPLFEAERRCLGGTSAECLPDGTHRCLHCGRIFKHYRIGFTNCGFPESRWWDLLNEQHPGWEDLDEMPDVVVPREMK